MGLIIKDKIGNVLAGTPTFSDKYDVISAVVGDKTVKSGQIVAFDEVFKGNGKPILKEPTANSKFVGVVLHQNIHLTCEDKEPQEFKPGEIVEIVIKGFVTAIAKTGSTQPKYKDGVLDDTGIVELKNIIFTGNKTTKDNFDILEVEIK